MITRRRPIGHVEPAVDGFTIAPRLSHVGTTTTSTAPDRTWLHRAGWISVSVLVVLFVIQNHSDLPDAWHSILKADRSWLAVTGAAMVVWLLNISWMHASAQRAAGLRPRRFELLYPAVAGNALNLVTKSGGMAGLTMFTAQARRRGQSRGSVIAAYALAQAVGEVAFALTLMIAFGLIWADGRLNHAEIAAMSVFVVFLSARLGLLVAAVRSRDAIRSLYTWPQRTWASLRRQTPPPTDVSAADDLYDAILMVRRHPRRALAVLAHAVALEALGIIELWGAAAAVGASTSLLVAFVGYSVSVMFAIVGFLPGGIGFVEISLGALLVSYGASVATATAAVVVYRVAELWLPLIIGFVTARSLRQANRFSP